MKRMMLILCLLLIVATSAGWLALRYHDGPIGPLTGGPLTGGTLVTQTEVNWLAASDGQIDQQDNPYFIELELVAPGSSRTTGILWHAGHAYIPCDLGFGWARMEGTTRLILQLIYWVKDWHHAAVRDGRVVLRLDGKRYPRQAVKVTDPAVVELLKDKLEAFTRRWQAPKPLAPRPTQGPRDIWFFRLDPR